MALLHMAIWVRRDRRDARPRAVVVMVGLAFLDVVVAWTIAVAFPQTREGLSSSGSGWLTYPLLGIVLIVLGPILPRLSPNSLVGVRVPGCMDPVRWPLLQRFGGRVSVVGGFIELVACLFWLRGMAAFYFTLTLMDCFLCTIADGTITLTEHSAAKWLDAEHLRSVSWLPADVKVVDAIEAQSIL